MNHLLIVDLFGALYTYSRSKSIDRSHKKSNIMKIFYYSPVINLME